MERQINELGGYLQNPNSTSDCSFCPVNSTNQFLEMFSIDPSQSWMDFGLLWAYIGFNICGCFLLYWAFRVPKTPRTAKKGE
jgi:ABC-type multidrug transport system permease subunit